MTRPIKERFRVSGSLVCQTPLSVGGLGTQHLTDLPLAVNGAGQYYIPGTSLAGALRHWCASHENVDAIWGYAEQKEDKGHASFIIVEDAIVQNDDIIPEIRDGVAIDRYSGTAANGMKYDRQILPKGTKLKLELLLECSAHSKEDTYGNSSPAVNQLSFLIKALESGKIRLGASKTRGLGKVKLENTEICNDIVNKKDGILDLLQNKSNTSTLPEPQAISERPRLEIEIKWKPKGPVMVKASEEGMSIDTLPLVSLTENGNLVQVLSGSGIKGAFRSHAERILATLLDIDTLGSPSKAGRNNFLEQINRRGKLPLIEDIFGSPSQSGNIKDEGEIEDKDDTSPLPGIGALYIDDCYATCEITKDQWHTLLNSQEDGSDRDAFVKGELDKTEWKNYQPNTHVAIDRWTGGAADGCLYNILEPPQDLEWDPIYFTLNLERLADKADVATTLILLVLRDFMDKKIPLGFGGTRGLGSIKVENVNFKISGAYEGDIDLDNKSFSKWNNLPDDLKETFEKLSESWERGIESHFSVIPKQTNQAAAS